MNITRETKHARAAMIQEAIKILNQSNKPITVKSIAILTGFNYLSLYKNETVKPHIQKKTPDPESISNTNYKEIRELGYSIQVTVGKDCKAFLYLIKSRKRQHRIEFKSNGKNSTQLNRYMPNARYYKSADLAMVTALELIKGEPNG